MTIPSAGQPLTDAVLSLRDPDGNPIHAIGDELGQLKATLDSASLPPTAAATAAAILAALGANPSAAAIAAAGDRNMVLGPTLVTVDTTATGKTLAALLTAASASLPATTKKVKLRPASAGIFWGIGSVTTGSAPLDAIGEDLEITKTIAETLKFIVASSTIKMTVYAEG